MGFLVISAEYRHANHNDGTQSGYRTGYLSETKHSVGTYFLNGVMSGIPYWVESVETALKFTSAEDTIARINRDMPHLTEHGGDIKSGSLTISEIEERGNNGCGPCGYPCSCKSPSGYCAVTVCVHPEHRFSRFIPNSVTIIDGTFKMKKT